jgi:hypothetical protein
VELLRARLEKTVQLTKKIKTSQARLETSGKQVQQAIGPIYGNTQRLQTLGRSKSRRFSVPFFFAPKFHPWGKLTYKERH